MTTTAKKSAKKKTTKKVAAAKKTAKTATPSKKSTKRATASKKSAKKATPSKKTAKKAPAKKDAKKPAAKKTSAAKATAKKTAAKKTGAKKTAAKKAPAKKAAKDAPLTVLGRFLGELPGDLAALFEHAAALGDDAFFTSPTYGELALSVAPAGASHYVDSADGEAWGLLFRDVAWIGEEADGGLVGYYRHPSDAPARVLYLDNEGSLRISGRSLVEHFAWRVGFDGESAHPELDAFCDAAGLARAGASAARADALQGEGDPSARLDRLIAAVRASQGPAERPVDRWPTCALLGDGRWLVISSEDDVTRPQTYEGHVAFAYDPNLGRFVRLADTPFRGYLSLHALGPLADGRTLVLSLAGEVKVALFDPATNTWSVGATLERAHDGGAAILLDDGRVAVIGGGWSGGAGGDLDLYDPARDRWSVGPAMPKKRRDFGVARLADGRVLAVGGSTFGYEDVAATEIYDPRKSTWTKAGALSEAQSSVSVLALADGRVLLTRGDELALFDPATGRWSPLKAREGAAQAMVPLADGRVAFFDRQRAALFDPASGALTIAGTTALTRGDATRGFELADGRILLVGGDLYNNIASEPELWDPRRGEGGPLPGFEKAFERQRKALAKRR